MISQEELYQYLVKEQWKEILDILHKHREQISDDPLLKVASQTFEGEFIRRINDDKDSKLEILEYLETLYQLHFGNYYKLTEENYKTVILEIVKRKDLKDAIGYANIFPNEEICKKKISEYKLMKAKEEGFKLEAPFILPTNWIEIYNRLFELMNTEDTATYFSGPRFIDTVRQYEPYFPTYHQFIQQRNTEGKSTTRKIFYYDILLSLSNEVRVQVVNRLLEILKPFEGDKVLLIENLLANKKQPIKPEYQSDAGTRRPNVFISYSWDSDEHKKWVLNLADKLCEDGIDVVLDRYFLKPGTNLPHFVEDHLDKADRVIVIFTKNYKLKADKRTGGVGYEYSIMNVELYKNQTSNEKIIPILREGSSEESIPAFMQQFIHIDTRNDDNFLNSYNDLVREIYNEPVIKQPVIGIKPTFTK